MALRRSEALRGLKAVDLLCGVKSLLFVGVFVGAGLRPLLSKTKQNDERKDRYVQASTQSHPKEARRESIMQHI